MPNCRCRCRTQTLPGLQRPDDGRKRNVVARDALPGKQGHLQTFRSGSKARRGRRGKTAAEDHLHLSDAADAEHTENAIERYLGLCFFPRLACGAFLQRLAVFQIACRQCPEAAARLD